MELSPKKLQVGSLSSFWAGIIALPLPAKVTLVSQQRTLFVCQEYRAKGCFFICLPEITPGKIRIFPNPENGQVFNIWILFSTRRGLVEDGGLSFGEVYITRSWEEDLCGPRWILTHRWRDPGQILGFCLGEITPRKKSWRASWPAGRPAHVAPVGGNSAP